MAISLRLKLVPYSSENCNITTNETEDKSLELEKFNQSLVTVDSSLRKLVRQNRNTIISQTRLEQQQLARKLWWAIAFAAGMGMTALIIAVISILRR